MRYLSHGRMERTDVLIALKLHFAELFITPRENIMIYEIGWFSIIFLLLSPIVIKKIKAKYKNTNYYRFYVFSLITGIACITMTLKIFPFEHLPSILKMLQFSFRLLEFSSFFFAFVVGVNFGVLIKKLNYKDISIVLLILILLTCTYIPHLHYAENVDESKIWPAVRVTSNTGRVHAGCASFEYLPCKAFENRSYIETRNEEILILEGEANIINTKKQGTNLECEILNSKENTLLELPYIYYLGYNVSIIENGIEKNIETIETENGFIGCKLPALTNTTLTVCYKGTLAMKITLIISILSLIAIAIKFIFDNKDAMFRPKPNKC